MVRTKCLATIFVSLLISILLSACALFQRGDDRRGIFYVAVGASDALGVGAVPLSNGYVFRIRDELEQQTRRRVSLLNVAIPSGTTRSVREALNFALDKGVKPDLVTVWIGANDLIRGVDPADFESELRGILKDLREKTSAFVVVGDIPDLTRIPRFKNQPSAVVTTDRIAAFNRAIVKQADAFDAKLVRISGQEIMDELISDIDGFHPSNRGHRMIARLFLEAILPRFASDERSKEA